MDIADVVNFAFSFKAQIVSIAESNFTTALAGAWGGAWAAQKSAEADNKKRRLLDEIRSTNAAISAAFSITNTFCGIKKQHIRELREKYDQQCKDREDFIEKHEKGLMKNEEPFAFDADLHSFYKVSTPIETLKTLLFEKISISGHALGLLDALELSILGVNELIESRNRVIDECQQQRLDGQALACVYFGIKDSANRVDERYSHAVRGIADLTDDCIFLSKLLGEALNAHGQKLKRTLGKKSPSIVNMDLSKAEGDGLIPSVENYTDWIQEPMSSEKKWWQGIFK